ncbi:hypothetical protein NL676_039739 [Syzygium grande]|nr:hypothetical protein NL676_039739 [Syzygium grande]
MSSPSPCTRSWSISEESLRRYVRFASDSCIQELLSASVGNDGWKAVTVKGDGVEISKCRSGPLHTFRIRWLLKSLSPHQTCGNGKQTRNHKRTWRNIDHTKKSS